MRKSKIEELRIYIEELKTIKREIIDVPYNKKFVQSTSYLFTLNNGRVIPREEISKGGNDGSAVIIFPLVKDSNEVLVTVEPRVLTKLGVSVGFPAGYIEQNEKVLDAAKRELLEETGYSAEELILLDSFYQDEGISSAFNHIVLARKCSKTHEQNLDKDEIVRYMTFTYEELLELERLGYINSSNTKLTLSKTNSYLKER